MNELLFVVKLLLSVICWVVLIILGHFLDKEIFCDKYLQKILNIIINLAGFNRIHISEKSKQRYYKVLNSGLKCLAIYNHRSYYDGIIMCSLFPKCKMLMNNCVSRHVPYFEDGLEKIGYIIFEPDKLNNNITQKILDVVKNRKKGDGVLMIAPDGMNKLSANECIAPYRSGAFVGLFPILPIVIKYKNYRISPEQTNYFNGAEAFVHKLLDDKCEVYIEVMKLVKPKCDVSFDKYKESVHRLMSQQYMNM